MCKSVFDCYSWVLGLSLVGVATFGLPSLAAANPLPPVPEVRAVSVQTSLMHSMEGELSAPALNKLVGISVQEHAVLLHVPPGSPPLKVKNRLVMSEPNRLVLDLENVQLGMPSGTVPSIYLGRLPVRGMRLAQFDATTVRVVIETENPAVWQLQPTLSNANTPALMVGLPPAIATSATSQRVGFAGRFMNHFRRHRTPITPPGPVVLSPAVGNAKPSLSSYPGLPISPARQRIVEAARSQLGISKAAQRDYVTQVYSRGQDQAWCADFVSTILSWSGQCPWGHTALVKEIYNWGLANQRLTRYPIPGDIVIFRFSSAGFDHTAIVESIRPDGTFSTIGGNEGSSRGAAPPGGMVQRSQYKLEDSRILGFVNPMLQETQAAFIGPSANARP